MKPLARLIALFITSLASALATVFLATRLSALLASGMPTAHLQAPGSAPWVLWFGSLVLVHLGAGAAGGLIARWSAGKGVGQGVHLAASLVMLYGGVQILGDWGHFAVFVQDLVLLAIAAGAMLFVALFAVRRNATHKTMTASTR